METAHTAAEHLEGFPHCGAKPFHIVGEFDVVVRSVERSGNAGLAEGAQGPGRAFGILAVDLQLRREAADIDGAIVEVDVAGNEDLRLHIAGDIDRAVGHGEVSVDHNDDCTGQVGSRRRDIERMHVLRDEVKSGLARSSRNEGFAGRGWQAKDAARRPGQRTQLPKEIVVHPAGIDLGRTADALVRGGGGIVGPIRPEGTADFRSVGGDDSCSRRGRGFA